MQRTPERSKTSSPSSNPLDLRLECYALAAVAAGVSTLTLAPPAEAEIIYKSVHIVLTDTHSHSLDVNGDGVPDFILRDILSSTASGHYSITLDIRAQAAGNMAAAYTTERGLVQFASALKSGAQIGPVKGAANPYLAIFAIGFGGTYYSLGPWVNVTNRYLGLRFQIKGEPHFGWARLSITVKLGRITARVTGYAYETITGKGIVAGQTTGTAADATLNPQLNGEARSASLGKLALGAAKPGAVQIPTEKAE